MEFDDLGEHCSFCRQRDILPMKCNFCGQYFCVDHIRYEDHKCPKASKGTKEVVLCKYCNQPIQLIPGVDIKILVCFILCISYSLTSIYAIIAFLKRKSLKSVPFQDVKRNSIL